MNILTIDSEASGLSATLSNLAFDKVWDSPSPATLLDLLQVARRLNLAIDDIVHDSQSAEGLRAFARSEAAAPGLAIISGLPSLVDPRRLILLLATALGSVVRYADEGDYIIEVKEDLSLTALRPGFNNSKEFFPHTDLSYIDEPPLFFCLHSLANDRRQGGFSEFADLHELLKLLPVSTIERLRATDYLFPAPKHYQAGGTVQRPILERSAAYGDTIRFRRDNLRTTNRLAINAVIDLCRAIQETMTETFLEEASLAIINNRRVLHGRTAFLGGQFATRARHINRLYFVPSAMPEGEASADY